MTSTNLAQLPLDQIMSLILSYGDANLVAAAFSQLGWSFNEEIKETLFIARQNKNLAAKLNAIKHLHTLVQEAAEASGYLAKVSRTVSAEDGSQLTFSARRIAGALNPPQKLIHKENDDEEQRQPPILRGGSDGAAGNESSTGEPCARDGFGEDVTGDESSDGRTAGGGGTYDGGIGGTDSPGFGEGGGDDRDAVPGDSPDAHDDACVDQRPPTCRRDLYPGVSLPTDGGTG